MRLLLDTQAFLWFIAGDPRTSTVARRLIEDEGNERWLSMASVWEIAIKVSIGKLQINLPLSASSSATPLEVLLPEQLSRNGIELLPIEMPHAVQVARLPFHHRDPFDRLIAAQSLLETLPLVSADPAFDAYGVTRLW